MATLKSLARRLNRLADNLDDVYLARRDKIAMAIMRALVDATPVDTSQALSNWRVSTSGTVGAHIAAHFPGEQGSTQGTSAAKALGDAMAALKAGKTTQALVIFNSVPYIRRLNEGYSGQAPAGFVEKAVLAGRLAARGK